MSGFYYGLSEKKTRKKKQLQDLIHTCLYACNPSSCGFCFLHLKQLKTDTIHKQADKGSVQFFWMAGTDASFNTPCTKSGSTTELF